MAGALEFAISRIAKNCRFRSRHGAMILATAILLAPQLARADAGRPAQSDFSEADYGGADAGFVVLSISLHGSDAGMHGVTLDAEKSDNQTRAAFALKTGLFDSHTFDYTGDDLVGNIVVRALPPGDYALTRFSGNPAGVCGSPTMEANFKIPFSVKAGQVTYLGSFRYEPITWSTVRGVICSRGGYFLVGNERARDTSAAKTKRATLPETLTAEIPVVETLNLPLFRSTPLPQRQPSPTALVAENSLHWGYKYLHKDMQTARDDIKDALRSGELWQSDIALAHSWLGGLDFENHDLKNAFDELSEAIRLDSALDTAWGDRGVVRLEQGDYQGARDDFKEASRLKPGDYAWLMQLGNAEAALHQSAQANLSFSDAISSAPRKAPPYFHRGSGEMMLGQYDAAIADIDHAIKLEDSPVPIYPAIRCIAGVRAGHGDAAMADCDTAVKLAPKAVAILDIRGFVHLLRNETALARADFDASLAITPDTPLALLGRGLSKQKAGDAAGGKADLDAAHQADPQIDNVLAAFYGIGTTASPGQL